jgi:hypothetical protein
MDAHYEDTLLPLLQSTLGTLKFMPVKSTDCGGYFKGIICRRFARPQLIIENGTFACQLAEYFRWQLQWNTGIEPMFRAWFHITVDDALVAISDPSRKMWFGLCLASQLMCPNDEWTEEGRYEPGFWDTPGPRYRP